MKPTPVTNVTVRLVAALCAVLVVTYRDTARAQGPLDPPGVPAPMMKSLDQIEARTIVNDANAPGDGTCQFLISSPGSYYLVGNLTGVSGLNGIRISADNVTLDLNGFALIGAADTGNGIVTGTVRNLAVRNGAVRGWKLNGIEASGTSNGVFEKVRASNNGAGGASTGKGIVAGAGCVLIGCVALENSNGGFEVTGGTLTGCVAQGNASNGFLDSYPGGSTFAQCTAQRNTGSGFSSASGGTFTGCIALGNTSYGFSVNFDATVTGCSASTNSVGIFCNNTCLVSQCTASHNRSDGISAFGACHILQNVTAVNGGDGIHTINPNNRIDGNHSSSNTGRGINAQGGSPFDFIIRNTCSSNTAGGYFPTSGTRFGPLGTPGSATSAWANFQ